MKCYMVNQTWTDSLWIGTASGLLCNERFDPIKDEEFD